MPSTPSGVAAFDNAVIVAEGLRQDYIRADPPATQADASAADIAYYETVAAAATANSINAATFEYALNDLRTRPPEAKKAVFDDGWLFARGAILKAKFCEIPDSEVMSCSMWVKIKQGDLNPGGTTIMSFGPRPKAVKYPPGTGAPKTYTIPPDQPLINFGPSRVIISGTSVIARLYDKNGQLVPDLDFITAPRVVKVGNVSGPFVLGEWNLIQFSVNIRTGTQPLFIKDHEYAFPCQTADLRYNGAVAYAYVQVWFNLDSISFNSESFQKFFSVDANGVRVPPLRHVLGRDDTVLEDDPLIAQKAFGPSAIFFAQLLSVDPTPFTHNRGTGGKFIPEGSITAFPPGPYGL